LGKAYTYLSMKLGLSVVLSSSLCFAQNVVLVGGGMYDPNIISQFVGLAGPPKQQTICTVTCAGGDPEGDAASLAATFQPLVKDVWWIPVTINNTAPNRDPAVLNKVKTCGGVYFSGGDQSNLLYCFYDGLTKPSPLLELLYTMNKAGTVIAGSSAGEVILSGPNMLTNGNSWNALVYGTFPTDPFIPGPRPDDVTYWKPGGFGFFPGSMGALDMHVGIRGRQARLLRLMLDTFAATNTQTGFGVGQDTAFFISDTLGHRPVGTVVGQDGVYILNIIPAKVTNTPKGWRVDNVMMSFLSPGDSYDFAYRNVTIESSKTLVTPGSELLPDPGTSTDIWSSPNNPTNRPHEFTKLCRRLFDAPQTAARGTTFETNPQYTVVLTKVGISRGYRSDSSDSIASFLNVDVSIFPS